ncbi:hypothetical protein [Scandinavium goeteborgense]|uniref:Uncharacterized protein n=1 Tax=Scandinavium goeteborgense TaxID=1851514 RepID=A0A4R6DS74_SCAGO|nr:hypothetical protein [Scandinavium goeteborgense]TDN47444.1 hypothetical protein EC847_13211 [Scandinavium goeteborgense]
MTENNVQTKDISLISKTPEMMEELLRKIDDAECDSLPEIHSKLLTLNLTLQQAIVTKNKIIEKHAFNMAIDIEGQLFEQLGYLEEKKDVFKEVIDRLDMLTDGFYTPSSTLNP